ncbi:MAG: ribose transport system ATP-binding protein [Actinomycetota bacterium]|nr:ribose transport system ATP-binding protein [Actinomycetota bacterium]
MTATPGHVPRLEVRNLAKTFGRTAALRGVDLTIERGEIHGLLGQNGSGKSTLIKILSGYHTPDPGGELYVDGNRVELPIPPGGFRPLGIAFVHQDLGLVDSLSVLHNLRVGRYRTGPFRNISWRYERRQVRAMLQRFDLRLDPEQPVSTLRDVDRALLAIVRAVADIETTGAGGLLVLDEPTVYLPRDSVERLFTAMREIAAERTAILFVSHQLHEVKAITDHVTVLRDGAVAGERTTSEVAEDELVDLIVGRAVGRLYPDRPTSAPRREVALEVAGLSGGLVHDVSFELRRGETLGVTGLVGMGYEDIPYLVYGALRATGGELRARWGAVKASNASPISSIERGFALVPANRQRDGVIAGLTVAENVAQPVLRRHARGRVLRLGRIRDAVRRVLLRFAVHPSDPAAEMHRLSGGNQQKALIGKWFQTEPSVLLLHEPTQGVDVGARQQIFGYVREAAERGAAVLIASSEHDDLAHLCDRVLVLRDGRIVADITGEDLTPDALLDASYRNVPVLEAS